MEDPNSPEFQVSLLDALREAMVDGRPPTVIDQIRAEMEETQRRAAREQDRHETLAMQWGGVGFRASNILAEIPAFRRQAELHRPTTLEELIPRVSNEHQRDTLQRLRYHGESRQIYLAGFTPARDLLGARDHAELEGEFTMMGTRNRRGERESYKIKWYKLPATRGSFWCNCPDHKFNSNKKQIVCKHICFLVCRVARLLDARFFETRQFTTEQHALFLRTVQENRIFTDTTLIRPTFLIPPTDNSALVDQRRAPFFECRKPITAEDTCPICCDTMEADGCVSCPTCSNNIHRDCMEVWLERKTTCVYCRSNVWSSW